MKTLSVKIIDTGNLEECLDFANNRDRQHHGRIFAPDEFARYAAFEHGEFQSLGLVRYYADQPGRTQGPPLQI